ncbi:hypothetical protein [Methylobacterium sp. WSM2598]|uniref:hypothetical protein n=1 Tax=Methylobacterium sp. WSM2598 TaxID=398261 RepID=UPI00036BB51B|nr:hypothetical protein [Methylobacterium sp. WSM2598]
MDAKLLIASCSLLAVFGSTRARVRLHLYEDDVSRRGRRLFGQFELIRESKDPQASANDVIEAAQSTRGIGAT